MIISRTPVRISFFGGGTDYPQYYEKFGGVVLSTSINQYTYINLTQLGRYFDHKYRISYSKTELVADHNAIEHPSVKACLNYLDIDDSLEINIVTDLPARTGLGSSSSFTVGLLNALYRMKGIEADQMQLSHDAIFVEQKVIKERVGSQDQMAAALGGLAVIEFSADNIKREVIKISDQRKRQLNQHICLFYTGIRRFAHNVLKEQMDRTDINIDYLNQMKEYVNNACDILQNGSDLEEFGRLMHKNWHLKKQLSSQISSAEIDEIYNQGIKHGALGGKLLGAGGGGFIMFFIPLELRYQFIEKMKPFMYTPARFEDTGSKIIFSGS